MSKIPIPKLPRKCHTTPVSKTIITPQVHWWKIDLADLWRNRHMVKFLVQRDIAVRYKQTFAGVLWLFLEPFIEMVVFTLVFHRFVGIQSADLPYPIFVYLGLLPWTYFSVSVSHMMVSVVSKKGLLLRMAFPRIFLPVSAALSKLVDLLAAFVILFLLIEGYGVQFSSQMLWMIPLLGLTVLASLSIGLWFAALHTLYRDTGLIVPYLLRLAMFLTPVIYPVTSVPEKWQWMLHLNPLVGIIEGFRAAVLQTAMPLDDLLRSGIIIAIIGIAGLFFFRRMEYRFVDEV